MPGVNEAVATFPACQKLVLAVVLQALEDHYRPCAAAPLMHRRLAGDFLQDPTAAEFCRDYDIDLERLERMYRERVKRG